MLRNGLILSLITLAFCSIFTMAADPTSGGVTPTGTNTTLVQDQSQVKELRKTVKQDKEQLRNDVSQFGKDSSQVQNDKEKLKADKKALRKARHQRHEDKEKIKATKIENAPAQQ